MDLRQELTILRREFHQYPELSFEEYRTGEKIAAYLSGLGLQIERIGTAVIAHLGEGAHTVALRADMDGLCLQEERDAPYRSKREGVMHACGHDGHMAMLLGAAKLLKARETELCGRVKFIFQPAEEKVQGADCLIAQHVLDDVEMIFGLHVLPDIVSGTVLLKKGSAMGTSDLFEITVLGQGGHGARPESGKNAILLATQLIMAITSYTLQFNPLESVVVNFGMIQGGVRYNIIPDKVVLTGTVRTLNEALRTKIEADLQEITKQITKAFSAEYRFVYERGCGVLENHPVACKAVERACSSLNIPFAYAEKPMLLAEDFAQYLQRVRGAYFWLGTKNEEKDCCYSLHHPLFDLDEDILPVGAALFAKLAQDYLEGVTEV